MRTPGRAKKTMDPPPLVAAFDATASSGTALKVVIAAGA
jgi:hypothetical protein